MSEEPSDLADAANVLVLASTIDDVGADACLDLLARETNPPDRLVVVSVGDTPSAWEQRIERRTALADLPVSYIDVKTMARSATTAETNGAGGPVPAATVPSPADLGSLGRALNEIFVDAARERERIGLCLSSITEMLQFVDRDFLFRFLHTLGSRVRQSDAVGYYHLDNDSRDDELETLFAHLTDAVVAIDERGMTVSPGYYAVGGEELEN